MDDTARARTLSLLRVARLETNWVALRRGDGEGPLVFAMRRDLQALRECAPGPGLDHVCDCVSRMLAFAEGQATAVPQSIAALMTMAIQLLGMLVRGGSGTGKAIEGFRREVHEALDEAGAPPSHGGGPTSDTVPVATRVERPLRPGPGWSGDLAIAATTAFLAHLGADGARRGRLHAAWKLLAEGMSGGRRSVAAMAVVRFRAACLPVDVAVPAGCQVEPAPATPEGPPPIDLLGACVGALEPHGEPAEPPLVLIVRAASLVVRVAAATEPVPCVAHRPCPTPDAHPTEIVTVQDVETVLIRPERLRLERSPS